MGNVLTEGMGKVLDIYTLLLDKGKVSSVTFIHNTILGLKIIIDKTLFHYLYNYLVSYYLYYTTLILEILLFDKTLQVSLFLIKSMILANL